MAKKKAKKVSQARLLQENRELQRKLQELQHDWVHTKQTVTELNIQSYSDVKAVVIKWLWQNKIPRDGITMFVGDPESFKSTTSLYVASVVSNGGCFPCCDTPTERGTVLIIGSEDSHEAVVKPRLMAAGADLTKVKFVTETMETHVVTRQEKTKAIIDLIAELHLLESFIKNTPDFRLLIIDAFASYLGARKINSMEDTRDFLDRLSELSYKYHFAILIIHHFNKNEEASSQYRGSGSTGIRAGVRAQWAFVKDKKEDGRAFMLRDKLNISPVKTGLAFHMEDVELNLDGEQVWHGRFVFDEEIHSDLTGFLHSKGQKESSKKNDAAGFLTEYLSDGQAHLANDVFEAAEEYGISKRTLRRAMCDAGIVVERIRDESGKAVRWTWRKPDGQQD